ncbi:MAG: FAD-dependent monooxygenase [Candidatus Wallbacteria bacterium]|nr:FAD-dependent monooxygenase [Candidatus Wallbacteria bacterium]
MPRAIVVGAGPVGLAAATWLARGGVEVLVVEGAPSLRERPCGEGVLPPGVAHLADLGVAGPAARAFLPVLDRAAGQPFRGISYWCEGREIAAADFPRRPDGWSDGLVVRRPALERSLAQHLRAHAGAELRFGVPVSELLREGTRVTGVVMRGRRERADVVIGADGLKSTVRRLLGLAPRTGPLGEGRFGVCGHFEWETSRPPLPRVQVHLIEGGEVYRTPCGPGAEGWIFLTSGARVRSWAGRLSDAFASHLRGDPALGEALRGARQAGRPGAVGPLASPALGRWAPGALLVGDAAGFLDALTGEGLALGLGTARQATALLLDHGLRVDGVLGARYEEMWRRTTGQPWALTRALLFLARHRSVARVVLGRLGRRPEAMSRLLGLNCGYGGLGRFLSADLWRLLARG